MDDSRDMESSVAHVWAAEPSGHDHSTGNAAFTRCLAITLVGMMTTQTHATAATCI